MTDSPLAALADHLVIPERSGVYLAKSEIVAFARATEGSLRINERRRMCLDVLRSAQTPAQLAALLGRLRDFCARQVREYRALVEAFPAAAPALGPWVARAEATIAMIEGVLEELALESEG